MGDHHGDQKTKREIKSEKVIKKTRLQSLNPSYTITKKNLEKKKE